MSEIGTHNVSLKNRIYGLEPIKTLMQKGAAFGYFRFF